MNVKDLSIGDWVCIHPVIHPEVCQVVKIYQHDLVWAKSDTGQVRRVNTDAVIPISITEKILQKSGFERCRPVAYAYEYQWRNDHKSIGICSFEGEIWFADYETEHGKLCNINIPLKYIHQLQHIFRLLGINQQIIKL